MGNSFDHSIEIDVPVSECFYMWSNVERFPMFMPCLKHVSGPRNGNVYHWLAAADANGQRVEWDVVVEAREHPRMISWHSVPGAVVDTSGTVRFEDVGYNSTRVQLSMTGNPVAGEDIAPLFCHPEEVLQCFKRLMLKQPAAVKSQGGLSESGSLEGSPANAPYNVFIHTSALQENPKGVLEELPPPPTDAE